MRIFMNFHANQRSLARSIINKLWKDLGIDAPTIELRTSLGNDIFDSNKLLKKIGHIDYVISIISEDYVIDPWLQKELFVFKAIEANRGEGSMFLPIVVDDSQIPDVLINSDTKIFNFKNEFDEPFNQLSQYITENRRVFIIMKMSDNDLELVYRDAMIPAIEDSKYTKLRIDDYKDSEKISPKILKAIRGSDIILCDLTGERPNCYYEAGYAEALGKVVILTAKKGTEVHFDLKDNQFIFWENANDLRVRLTERFKYIAKQS